ncbi:DUF4793 domain-containing protein [Trichonephila inaurata madagascariensis]|uniref:DUF4793 domain-containing protein n=1 Tax=Trichonephila inaurata madagascariensis TaxID=2747483 RepID=A0A8X6YI49_9ARAC|nr:DUF4793 domain-containing protein [Trichonephila inaurata madagascariensis]
MEPENEEKFESAEEMGKEKTSGHGKKKPGSGGTSKAIQKPPALDAPADKDEPQDLETLFDLYANFGDREGANGIALKNVDKWMRQAEILDSKYGITKEDTAQLFEEVAKEEKRIDLDSFQGFVHTLARNKQQDIETMMNKLLAAGRPKVQNMTDFMSKICKRKSANGDDASGEDSLSESESDEDTSSISSSQGVLTNETDIPYVCSNSLHHEELPTSYTCKHPFTKVARKHTLTYQVEETDYYYYIFSSNSYLDILPNEFSIKFIMDRTHYDYSTSIGNCSTDNHCQLSIPLGSHPKIVVQVEAVNGTLKTEKLRVACKPREWIFMIFYSLFLVVIFLCAFQ